MAVGGGRIEDERTGVRIGFPGKEERILVDSVPTGGTLPLRHLNQTSGQRTALDGANTHQTASSCPMANEFPTQTYLRAAFGQGILSR
jgi:hypothetical protein